MTRKRKSRKPGAAYVGTTKASAKEIASKEKRVRKANGKQAGNRQQEAKKSTTQETNNQQSKDPRLGSKKPIDLGQVKVVPPVEKTTQIKDKKSSIAAIHVIDKSDSYEEELYAIEDNQELQLIIEKQETGQELSDLEVDLFNEKMTRHEELRVLLGWDDEEETEQDIVAGQNKSDDDLWDKFDNSELENQD